MPTNNALFVDTSGWAAYFDRDDPRHTAVARLITDEIERRRVLVTTDYIIAELVSLFTSRHLRMPHAQMVIDITLLKSDPAIQVTYVGPARAEKAWEALVARPDKD